MEVKATFFLEMPDFNLVCIGWVLGTGKVDGGMCVWMDKCDGSKGTIEVVEVGMSVWIEVGDVGIDGCVGVGVVELEVGVGVGSVSFVGAEKVGHEVTLEGVGGKEGTEPNNYGWQQVVKYRRELSQVLLGGEVSDEVEVMETDLENGKDSSLKITCLETRSLLWVVSRQR